MSAPAPNQVRWMAGRTGLLAAVTGVATAFLYSDIQRVGNAAFPQAFLIGCISAATMFGVSMLLFLLLMPRMNPRLAVFISLALGALVGFVVGSVVPIETPA